jgi:hypothetical protein
VEVDVLGAGDRDERHVGHGSEDGKCRALNGPRRLAAPTVSSRRTAETRAVCDQELRVKSANPGRD